MKNKYDLLHDTKKIIKIQELFYTTFDFFQVNILVKLLKVSKQVLISVLNMLCSTTLCYLIIIAEFSM